MQLRPPSILLPVAGAALGFALAGKNYWAIGSGALAGMLGNALLNLAIVKNDAANRLGANVGAGPRVAGASMGKELYASVTGESFLPIYSDTLLKASQVEQAGGQLSAQMPSTPIETPKMTEKAPSDGSGAASSTVQSWMQQATAAAQQAQRQATMGSVAVAGPAQAKAPAKKVPAAARFRAGR